MSVTCFMPRRSTTSAGTPSGSSAISTCSSGRFRFQSSSVTGCSTWSRQLTSRKKNWFVSGWNRNWWIFCGKSIRRHDCPLSSEMKCPIPDVVASATFLSAGDTTIPVTDACEPGGTIMPV